MLQYIKFQGDTFVLTEGGAIATENQYKNGLCGYAHLYDGLIKRHGEIIGTKDDIETLGAANIEIDIAEAISNIFSGNGWPWDGLF